VYASFPLVVVVRILVVGWVICVGFPFLGGCWVFIAIDPLVLILLVLDLPVCTVVVAQGPKEAAITVYERKLEEAEKAKEAWKEARKEARCVVCLCLCVCVYSARGSAPGGSEDGMAHNTTGELTDHKRRKQLREEERKAKNGGSGGEEREEEDGDGGLDPEIAAAMGFGGFK
jgi:hypothetical protein